MTASDHTKVLKQLESKPGTIKKYEKHNNAKERHFGENAKKCKRCGRTGGHISKYGLKLCRQCFREIANDIGFKKFN